MPSDNPQRDMIVLTPLLTGWLSAQAAQLGEMLKVRGIKIEPPDRFSVSLASGIVLDVVVVARYVEPRKGSEA